MSDDKPVSKSQQRRLEIQEGASGVSPAELLKLADDLAMHFHHYAAKKVREAAAEIERLTLEVQKQHEKLVP